MQRRAFAVRNEIRYSKWVFSDALVAAGDEHRERALDASALGIDTLEAEVQCQDPSIAQFAQNAPMTYLYRGRQRGTYYLQHVERVGPDRYVLSGVSALGLLSQRGHVGGIYTGQTVAEVVADICGDLPVYVKSSLAGIALYGWLPYVEPPETSARDNLIQVLFAIGAYLGTDLDGVLRVEPLWDGVASTVPPDRIYQGARVEYSAPVTAVSVTEHQYIRGREAEVLFEGITQEGDIIPFDGPVSDLSANGFEILAHNANYAKVSAGNGTLTGVPYLHTTRAVTEPVQSAATPNTKSVEGVTLISSVNARAVAVRLAAYYRCTQVVSAPVVAGDERPGHVVSIYHPYLKQMVRACLMDADGAMSAVLRADTKALVDFAPPQVEDAEIFDYREEITQSKQFVAPPNSSYVRAVLISGGDGGGGGQGGTHGGTGGTATISAGQNGTKTGAAAAPGKGGAPGAAGIGGRIKVVDIPVKPGDVLDITIGKGGKGGDPDAVGLPGEDTRIRVNGEVYTTEGSTPSLSGYTDPVTGQVYAQPGIGGVAGADGGGPGTTTEAGRNGGSVGGNPGGKGNQTGIITGDSGQYGPWVYKRYQAHTSPGATENFGQVQRTFEGSTSYDVGPQGTIQPSSQTKVLGYRGGDTVLTGTVYTRARNGDVTSNGTATSSIVSITVEDKSTPGNIMYTKTEALITHNRYYERSRVTYRTGVLPGGGGGAADGAPGLDAPESRRGGDGADAIAPDAPTIPGSGGSGGSGGGGGGAGGAGYVEVSGNDSTVGLSKTAPGAPGGIAGKGAPGSSGADGIAILSYGTRRVLKNGPIVTRDAKWYLDKLGRRVIV